MAISSNKQVDISIVVTISEKVTDLEKIYLQFLEKMLSLQKSCEFIFVYSLDYSGLWATLEELQRKYSNIKIIKLRSVLSESVALSIGFENAKGKYILTLPVYFQISPDDIEKILQPLEAGYDMVTAWRYPRYDSFLNRLESKLFNWISRKLTGINLHDLGCGVTAMTKEVAGSLDIYGDLFRFMPILANRQGYRVGEVKVSHFRRIKKSGIYGIGVYIRRLLDILTIVFLVKFTKKPLRFFGLIGSLLFGSGFIISIHITIHKFLGNPIADRPLLILGVLLIVLGIQLISIGLIGEIIIFTHAKKIKEYNIEKILE